MSWLSTKEWQFGRQNVFAVDVGASDLPTTQPPSDVIQLGDWVLNLSGTVGAPAFWVCTTSTATTVTFTEGPVAGGSNQLRSSAVSTTLLSTDKYLVMSAAGAVTLPAPSSTLGAHDYSVKATGQPITITAASGGNLDGVTLGSLILSSYQTMSLLTDGLTNWYSVGRDYPEAVKTPTPPYTLATTDTKIIAATGAYTVPAPAGWALGQQFTVYSTGTVTITPASGNINGVAAVTLTTNHAGTYFTDGTNFFSLYV